MTQSVPTAVIGCDVGKAEIVVFNSRTGRTQTIPNAPGPLARFAESLDETCLVVCEPTGGHEAVLLDALSHAGRPAHRADASKVKAFRRSFGTLGKSDRLDARALAEYGRERHARLVRWQPPDAERDRLHRLVMFRRDLLADWTAWRNRAAAPTGRALTANIAPVIDCLTAQLAAVEADIRHLIDTVETLRQDAGALRAIIGIGERTAAGLIALMPELGRLDRRAAASLAGLAPHPRQSGARDGYRRIHGGRPEVRRTLFLAAMSAARHNPALRDFYQRLLAAGKKPLLALVAVMRKLVVIANAVLRDARRARSSVRLGAGSSVPA